MTSSVSKSKSKKRDARRSKQPREFRPPDPMFVSHEGDQVIFTAPKITSLTARHFPRATHEARRASLTGLTIDCQAVNWGEPGAMLQILAHTENLRNSGMHFDLLLPQDRSAARLFENAGWAHFLAPHLNDPPRFDVEHHLPTQRYVDATELATLRASVLEFAMRFLGSLRPELLRAIEWSLDEITDNVLNHADCPQGGFLQVDAPKGSGFLQIIVADGGRGIPESMREGHPRLRYDQDAVGEAISWG